MEIKWQEALLPGYVLLEQSRGLQTGKKKPDEINHLRWGILSSSNRKTHLVLNGALCEDQTQNLAEIFMFGETLTFPTKDVYMHIFTYNHDRE